MNYKKLVVMLCLGAHLLVTNSVAMAGWNPFKKLKKEIKKITKPIENAADAAAAAARDAANRAAAEAARIAAEEAARAQALAEAAARASADYAAREAARMADEAARLAALAERAALIETRFVASELVRTSQVLEAMTPAIDFLRGTTLSATSEIWEVEQELERIFPKVLNLNELELIAQIAHIRSVLERNNSLDLLRFWEPGWLEKVESRVSPVMAETGLPLFSAFRRLEEEISREFTKSDSLIWAIAKRASSMMEDISDDLIKPMASSYVALGSPGSVTSDATELAELDTTSGALPAQWDLDEKIQTVQSDFIADFNNEQFNQADADSNFLKVGLSPNLMPSEAELDDDDIFDEDCGYLPVPVRFGAIFTLIPVDRKVPKSCGGWKAKRGHKEFILASDVKDLLNASEKEFLEHKVGYSNYFKQPYGVAFDVRWLNAVQIRVGGIPVTVTITPHVRIPLAWSTPAPSPRTLSAGSGNNFLKNLAHDRMLISPEFELAFHAGELKSPLLSALVTNLEFPTAVKDLKNSPKSVLREIIVKVSYDHGIRWGPLAPKNGSDVLKALRLFLGLSSRAESAVAPVFYALGPTIAEATAAASTVAPAAAMALNPMLAFLTVLSGAEATIAAAAFKDDEEARTIYLTASMPFVMGLAGSLARAAQVNVARGSLRGVPGVASITDISLIKIQLVIGFLNANFVAGLLNREPTSADAGFELVRPGKSDYVSFGVALLPQVTQTLFMLDFGLFKTGLQLWGPYSIYTPQVAWPTTVAGQVYLKNGSDQFEPLILK